MAKTDFWPNLDLSDLAEYGLGLPQYQPPIPNKLFSWRIWSIKNGFQPGVNSNISFISGNFYNFTDDLNSPLDWL